MKTTITNELNDDITIAARCVTTCKQLLAGMGQVRNRITAEFAETLTAHKQLLNLALNEAEALAWNTDYPQLLFPTLATEKVQAIATWQTRQRALSRNRSNLAHAA
jgi:hypothetical protein